MSYGWEAKWVRRKFKMGEGLEVETCQDLSTGLIVCPLCIDVSKLCPSYVEASQASIPSGVMLLFSQDDLFYHMRAHAKSGEWRGHYASEEVEEEFEGRDEEEEEGEEG